MAQSPQKPKHPQSPQNPWYQATLPFQALGVRLQLHVPHDVFSTLRIDEGTELLLANLPTLAKPKAILDLGCGYGALGLPLAAKFPEATVELVDRDLVAVAWAKENAAENKLPNVVVYGSLGYRDIDPTKRFDWILCNVPARIGKPFIEHLLAAGRAMLSPQGEIRLVVIRDLAPTLEALRQERAWPLNEVARGPRHVIFALGAGTLNSEDQSLAEKTAAALYTRDEVSVGGLKFERPYDLHVDDPQLLAKGLPILLDGLPRQAPKRVLCFRSSYGPQPLIGRTRWPEAEVVAIDRDLLSTAFVRQNAARLELGGEKLEVREAAHFPDALKQTERFDLAIGELSAAGGEAVAAAELETLAKALEKGGQALVLILEKLERKWIPPIAAKRNLSINRLIARNGYALLRLSAR